MINVKRIFEWIGGFTLIAFSFYFTDQVSTLVLSKSELMKEIKEVSINYNEKPIDANLVGVIAYLSLISFRRSL